MLYYLARQSDGRIVLDREIMGALIESIEIADPPLVKRWTDKGLVEAPDYAVSYAAARAKVGVSGYRRTSEGWFHADD